MSRVFWWAAALLWSAAAVRAGGGPENVAVVVNADSWASLAVANEFIARRHVPPGNVIYLAGVSHWDHVPIGYFRDSLLRPVLVILQQRGLTGQIDYLAWGPDLPTKADSWLDQTAVKQLDLKPMHCCGVWLATTALTFLHDLTLAGDNAYTDLDANRYARSVQEPRYDDVPWTRENRQLMLDADAFFHEKEQRDNQRREKHAEKTDADRQWERDGASAALAQLEPLSQIHPNNADVLTTLATAQALAGQAEAALRSLQAAAACGWHNAGEIAADADFATVRGLPGFPKLVATMNSREFETFPSHGFRSSYGWTREGVAPAGTPAPHYLLSTALAVTSGRGNSVSEAVECMRRSAAADGTRPSGTIYYMRNGDIRSTTRLWAFSSAVKQLQALGVKAEIVDGVLPQKKNDVAGLQAGNAEFDWPASGSTMLPGAIAEHLTSFGGIMEYWAGQTPISAWIRAGAAGSAGTVFEPLAIGAKFPDAWVQVHYARGCSLAEALYQSTPGPYALLMVGDPLCQPWAKFPEVRVTGVRPGQVVSGKVTLSLAPGLDPQALDHIELFVDGVRQATAPPTGKLTYDTTGLQAGAHELRVVGIAAGPIETQGRVILPVFVRSRADRFQVAAPPQVSWDQPLLVPVALPGAHEIRLLHNGRLVGRLVGEKGTVSLAPRMLGLGSVQLQPVALIGAPGAELDGPPVTVRVTAPACWPALPPPTGKLVPGLRLQILDNGQVGHDSDPVVIPKLEPEPATELRRLGVEAFRPFRIDAWFTVPEDEIYQFQARVAAGTVSVKVDGHDLGSTREGAWVYLPVALQQGWHQVTISGIPEPPVGLEVNFGGPGSVPIGAPTFQCLAP
jgi:hypothetical protein